MKNLLNKVAGAASGAIVFAAACVMAGLGFAVVATLAVFGFIALATAVLVSPFIAMAQPNDDDAQDAKAAA